MILKMINQSQLTKQDRKKFIPFVNQRNHMGQIIKNKPKDKQYFKSIEIFQNLKKTTKEYFFDKKYQKMKQKLSRTKMSVQPKQPNYDLQIKQCFKSLQKSQLLQSKSSDNFYDSNTFFVDLNQKLNQNISTLKEQIQKNKKNRILKPKKLIKHKTFHNTQFRKRTLNDTNCSLNKKQIYNKENNIFGNQEFRKKAITSPNELNKQVNKETCSKVISSVNRQIFRDISKQSQKMVDFTNCGLKYRHMVQGQRKDPWKKWYVDYRVQIFPGQTLKLKRLQKSIYD